MKIIQKGNLKRKDKRYRFDCRVCGCVFECEDDEVREMFGSYNETVFAHDCPTCSEIVYGEQIVYRESVQDY